MDEEIPAGVVTNLFDSVTNEHTKDALVEYGETLLDDSLDSLLQNPLLKEVPVLRVILGVSAGVASIRTRRYTQKVLTMLIATSSTTEKERSAFSRKISASKDEAKHAGETILDIIDKITSTEKAEYIGKALVVFMRDDDFSLEELITVCEIIEKAYLADLRALKNSKPTNEARLESIGVRKPIRVEDINRAVDVAMKESVTRMEERLNTVRPGGFSRPAITGTETKLRQSGYTELGTRLLTVLAA